MNSERITNKARIEATVLNSLPPISKAEICRILPDVSPSTVEAVLGAMIRNGSRLEQPGLQGTFGKNLNFSKVYYHSASVSMRYILNSSDTISSSDIDGLKPYAAITALSLD